jgi:cytochrome c oxidase subunit 1
MPRRYADHLLYTTWQRYDLLNQFMTVSAIILGTAQLIFVANFFWSLFFGKRAERNPWHSNTLEWTAPSPPPHGNYEQTPIVRRGPYEYSAPGIDADFLPQTETLAPGVGEPARVH